MQHLSLWWANTSSTIIILAQLCGSLKIYFMSPLSPRSWCQTQALLTMGVPPPGHNDRIRGKSLTQGRQTWIIVKIVSFSSWAVKSVWASFLVAWGSWPIAVAFSHQVTPTSLRPPWTAACQASLPFTVSRSVLRFMPIRLVMLSNHLIFCHPLLLLPSIFLSLRVFSNESALCIRWLKYWSFTISPSSEYSGLMSFRTHWFDLLVVQGTL